MRGSLPLFFFSNFSFKKIMFFFDLFRFSIVFIFSFFFIFHFFFVWPREHNSVVCHLSFCSFYCASVTRHDHRRNQVSNETQCHSQQQARHVFCWSATHGRALLSPGADQWWADCVFGDPPIGCCLRHRHGADNALAPWRRVQTRFTSSSLLMAATMTSTASMWMASTPSTR